MKNKKNSKKWGKTFFKIGIAVIAAAGVLTLVRVLTSRDQGAKLVESHQKQDASISINKEPTAKEFADTIPSVLKRASSTRDFSTPLQKIQMILKQFDEENPTSSDVNILNYLGNYKVVIKVNVVEDIESEQLHQACLESFSQILSMSADFSRVEVDVVSGSNSIERFYISSSSNPTLVFDRKFTEDLAMGDKPSCLSKFEKLQKQFSTVDVSVDGYTTEMYDAVTVVLDTSASQNGTLDCIDYIDFAFQMINKDFKNPVYLQVFEKAKTSLASDESEEATYTNTLVFSGYVLPGAQNFKDFYSAKPYYQDISRAEYYLCNDWLYGNVLSQVSTYVENLI